MAKRGAAEQLTHGNWDREGEPEQAGHFQVAGNDQLSKRIIKKAKRRVTGSEESTKSYKGFQGFGIPQNSSTPMTNSATSTFTAFKGFGEKKEVKSEQVTSSGEKTSDSAYMTQLKRLNQEVCEWIKRHISENPYVDLSPVFKDYEKHLLNLEKKFPACKPAEEGGAKLSEVTTANVTTFPVSNIQSVRGPSSTVGAPTLNGSSGISSSQANVDQQRNDTEGADDTPKTQSQVKSTPEEDAFYSIRCKLFFKRGEEWAELGIGMLSLKKIDEKIQVLIRNDTALGKILLNVFTGETTPTSRYGKNNVLLMSVPNPPVFGKEGDNTKPVSYLIRVKTGESADELQKHLQAAKNSA